MPTKLRIMCWNIAEGSMTGTLPDNSTLPRIADQIRSMSPDIVLLNEVKNWRSPWGDGVNQVQALSDTTGLPHRHWAHTTMTGVTGHKAVGILSRYPLGEPVVHPVIHDDDETSFATLETSFKVDNVLHHVLSTRFAPRNSDDHLDENLLGIQQAVDLVRKFEPHEPVIFGGDFNAASSSSEMANFVANSGLKDAFVEHPDPQICGDPNTRIDFIFYRGPYQVNIVQQRCPWTSGNEPSDHPWVFVDLQNIAA